MVKIMEDPNAMECVGSNDSAETMKLFDEINDSVSQIKSSITNFKNKVGNGEISTAKGISLLEVKNQMLLSYLTNVLYVILKKCSGKTINGDSAIERLVETRTVLERIRPIEQKLKYQIDKMVKAAATGNVDPNDPSRFRANPDNLVNDVGDSEDESEDEKGGQENKEMDDKRKSGIYVPPKLVAMHYDGDDTKSAKQEKLLERARRHALNSSVLQDLREEYLDTPAEVAQATTLKAKQSARMKERQEYEETYFTRLPSTKKDKHKSRSFMTDGNVDNEVINFENIRVLDSTSDYTPSGKKRKANTKSSKKKSFKSKKRRFH